MQAINLISNEHNMKYADFVVRGKLLAPGQIVKSLLNKTGNAFILNGKVFIYTPGFGVYVSLGESSLMGDLAGLFISFNLAYCVKKSYIKKIVWQIYTLPPQDKEINYDYITFKNGHFKTGVYVEGRTPEIVSISYIDVEYQENVEHVTFRRFLDFQFEPETQKYIQAFIWSVLRGDNRSRIFLFLCFKKRSFFYPEVRVKVCLSIFYACW